MAITNAQQYKQLVNPPLDGKRPGYRGDAAARSSGAKSQGRVGGSDVGESRTRSAPGDDRPQQIIGGKSYDVTPENRKQRDDLVEEQRQLREIEKKKFIYEPANYPGYVPGYLKTLANLNREPNRRYFVDKVLKGKNATTLLNRSLGLDEDDLSFSPYDLTEEQFEKAYQDYMTDRMSGKTDAMGNINPSFGRDDGGGDGMSDYEKRLLELEKQNAALKEQAPTTTQNPFAYRFMADGGIMNTDIVGGMMDGNMDEMGRQMYGLGKLVKKATRGIKKLVKSPVGKIALLAGGAGLLSGGGFGLPSFLKSEGLKKFFLKEGAEKFALKNLSQRGLMAGIAGLSALPFIFQGQEDEEEFDPYRGPDIDIDKIRSDPYGAMGGAYRFAADGGIMRAGYQEGGDAEPVAKKTMPLIDMDGKEKDYRETGGFVDMGRMERADDVPARLSKNEFVFTADAVRNAGDGNIDKGAEVMYNMMKNLEAGGDVSEESQGLEGARKMFQTSQRLEEVL